MIAEAPALDIRQMGIDFKQSDFVRCIDNEIAMKMAIKVDGDSVMFNPRNMSLGRFYFVELHNEPYLYRKVSENEVEIYGLAEQT